MIGIEPLRQQLVMTDEGNKEEIPSKGVQRGGDPEGAMNYQGNRVVVNMHFTKPSF